jgi:hypothetical protein
VGEAARVLKDGGAFKFQVNGDRALAGSGYERDTWLGEVFSEAEVGDMLSRTGFSLISSEGAGTQYYVVTAVKGAPPPSRSYVLPGEPWAEPLLLEGFGAAVDSSWRPLAGKARVRVAGAGRRLYLGLYFWPESCSHRLSVGGCSFEVATPGDHYFECPGRAGEVEILISPTPLKAPAFRVIGLTY